MRLSTAALEKEVADILGRDVGIYDISKKDAAVVIDQLTANAGTQGASWRIRLSCCWHAETGDPKCRL